MNINTNISDPVKNISVTAFGGVSDKERGLNLTGSCNMIEVLYESGKFKRILVDIGMSQGIKDEEGFNSRVFPFDPTSIDVVVLTHAHIDHIGLLPRLYNEGFKGKIYTHKNAIDDIREILNDSCDINLKEIAKVKEIRKRMSKKLKIALENATKTGKREALKEVKKKDLEDVTIALYKLLDYKISNEEDLHKFKKAEEQKIEELEIRLQDFEDMLVDLFSLEIASFKYNKKLKLVEDEYNLLKAESLFSADFKDALISFKHFLDNEKSNITKKLSEDELKVKEKKKEYEKVKKNVNKLKQLYVRLDAANSYLDENKSKYKKLTSLKNVIFDLLNHNRRSIFTQDKNQVLIFKESVQMPIDSILSYEDVYPREKLVEIQRALVYNFFHDSNYADISILNKMFSSNRKNLSLKKSFDSKEKKLKGFFGNTKNKLNFVKIEGNLLSAYKNYFNSSYSFGIKKFEDTFYPFSREYLNVEDEKKRVLSQIESLENPEKFENVVASQEVRKNKVNLDKRDKKDSEENSVKRRRRKRTKKPALEQTSRKKTVRKGPIKIRENNVSFLSRKTPKPVYGKNTRVEKKASKESLEKKLSFKLKYLKYLKEGNSDVLVELLKSDYNKLNIKMKSTKWFILASDCMRDITYNDNEIKAIKSSFNTAYFEKLPALKSSLDSAKIKLNELEMKSELEKIKQKRLSLDKTETPEEFPYTYESLDEDERDVLNSINLNAVKKLKKNIEKKEVSISKILENKNYPRFERIGLLRQKNSSLYKERKAYLVKIKSFDIKMKKISNEISLIENSFSYYMYELEKEINELNRKISEM